MKEREKITEMGRGAEGKSGAFAPPELKNPDFFKT